MQIMVHHMMIMSDKIYLSLGSNIGDREANLAGAITILGNYQENSKLKYLKILLSVVYRLLSKINYAQRHQPS